ncbi:hypothetical protein MUTS15_08070 [Escherichia coli]|nr:hypothetical protein MUTS15_08070 [Escherichia coli]BDZ00755.1 hypothetical protein MUTS16_18280 [Escherichia coli]
MITVSFEQDKINLNFYSDAHSREIFNDCFYVQLLLSVHKLNDIIHIINGRDILHETYPFN